MGRALYDPSFLPLTYSLIHSFLHPSLVFITTGNFISSTRFRIRYRVEFVVSWDLACINIYHCAYIHTFCRIHSSSVLIPIIPVLQLMNRNLGGGGVGFVASLDESDVNGFLL